MPEITMRLAGESRRLLPKKIPFTIKALENLRVPDGADRVWAYDARTPHLAFLKTRRNATAFYWMGRNAGRPIRFRLGGKGITIEQARNLTAAVTADNAKGVNLRVQRDATRADATLREIFDRFVDHKKVIGRRDWPKDRERFEKHCPHLAGRLAKSITTDDVEQLRDRIGSIVANRVLALLNATFRHAKLATNPVQGVARLPEHSRDRVLSPDEIRSFFKALERTRQPWRDLFEVALLTGQRMGNVKSMRWDELNLPDAIWRIPPEKSKSTEGFQVVLVPRVLRILKHRANGSEWVFPSSRSLDRPVKRPQPAWRELRSRAKLDGVRMHDLRATCATMQAELGVSAYAIQKSLGHKAPATTARYVRLGLGAVRQGMSAAATEMLRIAKRRPAKRRR